MRFSDAAKVGLAALAAVAVLVWITFALRGPLRGTTYLRDVSFDDARGIQEGAPVRVRGVDVGQVHEISLGSRGKAIVTLRVSREYDIRPDDRIQIVGGALGFGQPYVEILPGGREKPVQVGEGEPLPGESGTGTETILSRSEQLLTNLNGLVTRLNGITEGFEQTVNDPRIRASFKTTALNFEKMSSGGVNVVRNLERTTAGADRLIAGFRGTAADLDRTLRRADALFATFNGTAAESRALMQDTRKMVHDTRGVVADAGDLVRNTNQVVKNSGEVVTGLQSALDENRLRLKEVFDGLNGSLQRLNGALEEAQGFLGDPELRGDLKQTAANVREATQNLQKLTTDLRAVTADPKVQEDLKATLGNLRDASSEAAEAFRRVRTLLGGKSASGSKLRETEFRSDFTRGFESGRSRLDLNATIPWSDNSFYRVGLFDLGNSLKLNAQAGRRLAPNIWARAGVYGSALGLGVDVGKPAKPFLGLDLYRTDRPRFDARGYIPLMKSLDLTVGVDNVIRNPDPVIGLRYRR